MRVSMRARYGLLAMIELGLRQGQGYVQVKTMAEEQGIPEEYLEQLMLPLARARLVRSKRGARGGYMLTRPAEEINLLEVVEALDGPILAFTPEEPKVPDQPQQSAAGEVWQRLREVMEETLHSITLAQVCRWQLEIQAKRAPMYHI